MFRQRIYISPAITFRESSAVALYLSELGGLPLISAEEECRLAERIREGDGEALNRLVRANLRFVVSVAKKFQHRGLPLADLIAEGNLGLIRAAELFDPTRGFKFISFAVWWVRQAMSDALIEQGRVIRLPDNVVHALNNLSQTRAVLENELDRAPTEAELGELLELSEAKVRELGRAAQRTDSYDEPLPDGEGQVLVDTLADSGRDPLGQLLAQAENELLGELVDKLQPVDSQIIRLHFGLNEQHPLQYLEIARRLGIRVDIVRKRCQESLNQLRYQLLNDEDESNSYLQ